MKHVLILAVYNRDKVYCLCLQVFSELANTTDVLRKIIPNFQLWLNIEAYDVLHDDPCLPIDRAGSGLSQMLNRVTKSRLDRVLTHTGTTVQKVVSSAWDPSFTCTTMNHSSALTNQIVADTKRPIIAHCGFHSRFNRSVVVIGYDLEQETQGFMVSITEIQV